MSRVEVIPQLSIFLLAAGLVLLPPALAAEALKPMHTGHDVMEMDAGSNQGSPDHSDMDHDDTAHTQKDQGTLQTDAGSGEETMDQTGMDHSKMDHSKMIMAAKKEDPALSDQVKVEEQLGNFAALDTYFKDETGKSIKLETIFDKPVVLLPVYFMCTSICNFLQADLANALNFVDQIPGKDFNVITVSFADDENHTHANTSKRNYTNLITRDFPLENWFYLTGDKENIRKLTDSLGYYFIKKKAHFYIHPSALIVLAKDGKIIRYLYGPNFLPFDLGMALSEAKKGEPGVSIKRGVLSFCFGYDPKNKTYVFKIFRITGTAILILLVGFIIFLLYPSKKRQIKKDKTVS